MEPIESERWYTYRDVAALFAVKLDTVMGWVVAGQIPSPRYMNSSARFSPADFHHIKTVGLSAPGTYTHTPSPRAKIGARGAAARDAKMRKSLRKLNPPSKGKAVLKDKPSTKKKGVKK